MQVTQRAAAEAVEEPPSVEVSAIEEDEDAPKSRVIAQISKKKSRKLRAPPQRRVMLLPTKSYP